MRIVFIGLTVSSSWGNGHATTYRALLKALKKMGHEVHFLERDKPWYRNTRDFSHSEDYQLSFYDNLPELKREYCELINHADMVIVGSYVPEGPQVCEWVLQAAHGVKAFYDIDTPVTLDKLAENDYGYISPSLIPGFDLYLSFAGGRALEILEMRYKAKVAKPLYCSVDPDLYYPLVTEKRWKLGYLGTYSDDRQPTLRELLVEPAKQLPGGKFVVAGPAYPEHIQWPENVERIDHLSPDKHNTFYNQQRITLNITRGAMKILGHSPSVRLFEAAACGIPVLSDDWPGLTDIFTDGAEILIAHNRREALEILNNTDDRELKGIGEAAREKILKEHTSARRANQLVSYYNEVSKMEVLK